MQAVVIYAVTAVCGFHLNRHVSDLELAGKRCCYLLAHVIGASAIRNDDVH